jgi:hypothetical protein
VNDGADASVNVVTADAPVATGRIANAASGASIRRIALFDFMEHSLV